MIGKIKITPYEHPPELPHPEWATCDRTSCTKAALYGYNTALFAVKVCQEHLPDGIDYEEFGQCWWESVPEELQ